MYSDSGTSPSYSDTPAVWKAGKYILLTLVMGMIYFRQTFYRNSSNTITIYFVLLIWMLIINLAWGINPSPLPNLETNYIFWALLFLPLIYVSDDVKLQFASFFDRYFIQISIVTVISNAYVIANYYLTGRLTALSYEGSLLRFGGLWDDPNGFGIFSSFLAYCALKKKNWILFILLVGCVYYTVSFSSYLNLIVAICIWGVHSGKIEKQLKYFMLVGGIGLTAIFLRGAEKSIDFFSSNLAEKQGSINAHETFNFEFLIFPYFNHGPISHETWYLSFLYNYSPISPFYLVLFGYYLYKLIMRKNKSLGEVYMILFLIEACFIPVFLVFPLNVLFFIFFYTSETKRITNHANGETAIPSF